MNKYIGHTNQLFGVEEMRLCKGKGDGKKMEAMGFEIGPEMMSMMGGFTVLRMTSMMGMANISFTKEELLKINAQLNKIRKPKAKK